MTLTKHSDGSLIFVDTNVKPTRVIEIRLFYYCKVGEEHVLVAFDGINCDSSDVVISYKLYNHIKTIQVYTVKGN